MKKNLLKGGLVVGIIALFVGASVISGVGGDAKDLGLKDEENSMTVWTGINYKYNNVTLCGYTFYEEGDPAPIGYVELTNLDSGQKYYPDFEDNFWHKELILGEDIWIYAAFEVYAEDDTGFFTNTSQRIFIEIDLVNWWNLTLRQGGGPEFIRGDCTCDGFIGWDDVNCLTPPYPPPPGCDDRLDVNDDGEFDLADVVYLIQYLSGGPPPPPPFPYCGPDPTADGLDCDYYTPCENHPPYQPSNPHPEEGATYVSIGANLSWDGGDPDPGDTVTYDVYFGNSTPPPKVESHQTETMYDPPGDMEFNTTYYWMIVAWDSHGVGNMGDVWRFTTKTPGVICGDCNCDGEITVADVIFLINYLFRGGPEPIPMLCVGDVTADGVVNIGDVVHLINYLFRGGSAPCEDCCNLPWGC